MVSLNDYLYSGDTVLRILHNYIKDLRKDAKMTGNEIDMIVISFYRFRNYWNIMTS